MFVSYILREDLRSPISKIYSSAFIDLMNTIHSSSPGAHSMGTSPYVPDVQIPDGAVGACAVFHS